MTRPHTPPPQPGVPLPRLSDEAAVELYLFVEHLFLLIESRYSAQIRRHFDDQLPHNLIGPDLDSPPDDPPF
ncbi:hypothetical protein [Roseateles saccharophilus]|uniref:Uncharacterized protein n=1 Tax=Roseateles saccharophilus TaxID=304 RepID=A0A4R3U3Z4_ROSSA|nr:hypothetical protein [Roseateles saccharophilus]MDG0836249.1 hypothetical protein [Roseateles saccharophilus]TCU81131.1 hypothetical protein EV671_10913 [Roseateles saccharophilus]